MAWPFSTQVLNLFLKVRTRVTKPARVLGLAGTGNTGMEMAGTGTGTDFSLPARGYPRVLLGFLNRL